MSNIFGNGVFVEGSMIYTLRDDKRGQVNDYFANFQNVKASDEECAIVARHVKHAIDSHDGLVRALENLREACTSIRGIDMELYIPGVLAEVDRELARAKGDS